MNPCADVLMAKKEAQLLKNNQKARFAAQAGVWLLALRLLFTGFTFFQIWAVSVRCIFMDSLIDFFVSVGNLYVIQKLDRKANIRFPFGYGKISYLWNFFQGFCLMGAAAFLSIEALQTYNQNMQFFVDAHSAFLSGITFFITLVLCMIEAYVNYDIEHDIVHASMVNHGLDLLNQGFCWLSIWAIGHGYFGLDYLLALLIVLGMAFSGFRIAYKACLFLCDASVQPALLEEIENQVKEVCLRELGWKVIRSRMRCYGTSNVVECSLAPPKSLTLSELQRGLQQIEEACANRWGHTQLHFELAS